MNLMLSGGAGYISSHTAVAQSELGHQDALCDNLSNSSDSVLEKLTQITGQVITFVIGDVRDTDLHRGTPTSHNIDAVYALQGLKVVGESIKKPTDHYANNISDATACCKQCSLLKSRRSC
jgi:UDP-glucose 4-epimerase